MTPLNAPIAKPPERSFGEDLRSCWCDPQATPELAERYRARQATALAQQLPLASGAVCLVAAMGYFVAKDRLDHALLLPWVFAVLMVAVGCLAAWYLLVWRKVASAGSRGTTLALSAMLGLAALLYASFTVAMFGRVEPGDRLILASIVAAFIATGAWQFAVVPLAGASWVGAWCPVMTVGLLVSYGAEFAFIAALMIIFWVYLTGAVLVTSQRFIATLMAETALDQQREVVGLLLRDFEDNASDWLWETDAGGFLHHVSPRMASAIGGEADAMAHQSLLALFAQRLPSAQVDADAAGALAQLRLQFDQRLPFSQAPLATQFETSARWWSLTAKPLFAANGAFTGWRGVGSDITSVRLREADMTRLANTDSLTGLSNRHHFGQVLQARFSAETDQPGPLAPFTLITLDLDYFKTVNDTLGHLAGDELLKEVARRLQGLTPSDALLARLGGDEFAWVLPKALERWQAQDFGELVRGALAEPWLHQERLLDIGASLGVANSPADGATPMALLQACDMALYEAKANGRNRLCFFDARLDEHARRRMELLGDLRQGLAREEFHVVYQPQIRFGDNALLGFEALLRWQHPLRGAVAPVEFIALAEENGLIVPLGAWVMAQACRDAMTWSAPLSVAVNVSSVQIERSNLLATVRAALQTSGLSASRLELEITESSLMQEGDTAFALLNKLRQFGVHIALDDFGTGYSSLSYLQRLPIDKLKVDRSFVMAASVPAAPESNSQGARSILRAIVHLARALGLETTAEGVETEEVAALLDDLGFQQAQGYLYARPMRAQDVQAFIDRWPTVASTMASSAEASGEASAESNAALTSPAALAAVNRPTLH